MISLRDLTRALGADDAIADWAVVERAQQLATATTGLVRRDQRTRYSVIGHVDVADGRGTAVVELAAGAATVADVVGRVKALAQAAIGQAWRSPAAAAHARVDVVDPDLARAVSDRKQEIVAIERFARELFDSARVAAGDSGLNVTTSALRERVAVVTGAGARAEWVASEFAIRGRIGQIAIDRAERTRLVLDAPSAVAAAARDARDLARARPLAPGNYEVVLANEALLHGGLGVWSVFARHGEARIEHEGVSRFRAGAPIASGAAEAAQPLAVTSDGALPYGLRSAPVGEHGDPVRRFAIVDAGRWAGLGMLAREAALREREPNGGVRNLIINPGRWDHVVANGALEVRRLRSLRIDPFTGDASLDILLAIDRTRDAPVTGGTIRLDLIDALAHARRSESIVQRGAYRGPIAIWLAGPVMVA